MSSARGYSGTGSLAYAYVLAGRRADASDVLRRLLDAARGPVRELSLEIAVTYAALGDKGFGVRLAERSLFQPLVSADLPGSRSALRDAPRRSAIHDAGPQNRISL